MAWPADADSFSTSRDNLWNLFCSRQNQRERPGPKRLSQFVREFRPILHATFRHFIAGDVNNDGVVGRTTFDFKNSCDSLGVERICREAVNSFRRQCDDFTGTKKFRRAADGFLKKFRRMRGKNFSGHTLFVAQSVNRVELGCFPRRIKAGDDADDGAGNERDGNPAKGSDGRHIFYVGDEP